MFNISLPWWEFIARALLVYLFLILALRLSGKRQIGQLSPFDLVLLLILSNAVQNSMNGGDNSLTGGLISALTLIVLNHSVGYLTFKNKKLEELVDGRPEVLIHNGRLFQDILDKEKLTNSELNSALREAGYNSVDQVHFAILETNGKISIQGKPNNKS